MTTLREIMINKNREKQIRSLEKDLYLFLAVLEFEPLNAPLYSQLKSIGERHIKTTYNLSHRELHLLIVNYQLINIK